MPTTTSKLWICFATVFAVVIAATTAVAEDAKEADAKKPERQMLNNIFAPILKDPGSLNTQKATIISGPIIIDTVKYIGGRTKTPVTAKQWEVELGNCKFKITIDDEAKKWTIQDALSRVEQFPVPYRRALEIISEEGKTGLTFYQGLGGAHGGKDYINVEPGCGTSTMLHECGHCFDQRARDSNPNLIEQWKAAIEKDNIGVSGYGDRVAHEDLAEFAMLYAHCIDYAAGRGMTNELKKLSPKRFELWEQILRTCKALPILHLDAEFNPLGGPLHEGKGNTDNAKVKIISGPTKVQMTQYSRPVNKMITIDCKQWLVSLGDAKFKITFEDTEMQLKLEDAVRLVETLPPAYRAGLVATSEENETGLTIYKGGCAYGVPDRIGMGGHNLSATTLAHECGHTVDQKSRELDKDIMTKWGLAKMRDGVSVSGYGNGPIHEDQAEFARLYAISLAHGPEYLAKLKSLAPTRYAVWERMLVLTGGMDAKDAAPAPDFDFDAELKKHAEVSEKMKPKLKQVHETIKLLPVKSCAKRQEVVKHHV